MMMPESEVVFEFSGKSPELQLSELVGDFALCVGAPKDIWHSEKPAEIAEARATCEACPVKLGCALLGTVMGLGPGISGKSVVKQENSSRFYDQYRRAPITTIRTLRSIAEQS